uniref:SRP40_C domain-containing protein n=1 Tax=Angiostrongylus cantonensis TaxID=6313 RepID=A0A0K0DK59_ANGCA
LVNKVNNLKKYTIGNVTRRLPCLMYAKRASGNHSDSHRPERFSNVAGKTLTYFLHFFLHSLIYYSSLPPSTYDLVFKRKSNEPFRRVTISKDSLPSKFKDNSFDKSHDKWGAKAHEALSKVQGKGFRHEKTKKKKGSYGGGTISTGVNSIKFSDSE